MRVKLIISYNGKHFLGLQSQTYTSNTILGTVQKGLKTLGINSKLVASGRTDKEVHATRQVIHFDLPPYWDNLEKLKKSLKYQLPQTIMIRNLEFVSDTFHARYSAKRRVYRYILCDKKANPFEMDFITFVDNKLHLETLQSAISMFIGEHNFEMFKKNGSSTPHYVRTIYKAFAYKHHGYTILYFEANGFLRSQIRLMVSFILQINDKKLSNIELQEQLNCKKLHSLSLAPPNGLYLSNVIY